MSKFLVCQIDNSQRLQFKSHLIKKLVSLKDQQSTESFLNDLFTESEWVMIFRRLQVAKMLLEGKNYRSIRQVLGVGFDTIKTIRKKLDQSRGGFVEFIRKIK